MQMAFKASRVFVERVAQWTVYPFRSGVREITLLCGGLFGLSYTKADIAPLIIQAAPHPAAGWAELFVGFTGIALFMTVARAVLYVRREGWINLQERAQRDFMLFEFASLGGAALKVYFIQAQ
jgi:hypothetical protein